MSAIRGNGVISGTVSWCTVVWPGVAVSVQYLRAEIGGILPINGIWCLPINSAFAAQIVFSLSVTIQWLNTKAASWHSLRRHTQPLYSNIISLALSVTHCPANNESTWYNEHQLVQ